MSRTIGVIEIAQDAIGVAAPKSAIDEFTNKAFYDVGNSVYMTIAVGVEIANYLDSLGKISHDSDPGEAIEILNSFIRNDIIGYVGEFIKSDVGEGSLNKVRPGKVIVIRNMDKDKDGGMSELVVYVVFFLVFDDSTLDKLPTSVTEMADMIMNGESHYAMMFQTEEQFTDLRESGMWLRG